MRHQSIRAYVNQFVAQFSNDFSLEVYLIPSSGLVGDPDGRQNFLICDTHWWKLITGLHLGISASTSSSQTSISCTLLNNTTGLPICWKVIKSLSNLLHLPQRDKSTEIICGRDWAVIWCFENCCGESHASTLLHHRGLPIQSRLKMRAKIPLGVRSCHPNWWWSFLACWMEQTWCHACKWVGNGRRLHPILACHTIRLPRICKRHGIIFSFGQVTL